MGDICKPTRSICGCLCSILLIATFVCGSNVKTDESTDILKIPRHAELVHAEAPAVKYSRRGNELENYAGLHQLFANQHEETRISRTAQLLLEELKANPIYISQPCLNHTEIFLNALSNSGQQYNYWARQMVDSMGKPAAGILEGRVKWLGDWKQCIGIEPIVVSSTGASRPFNTKYCLSGFKVDSQASPILQYLGPNVQLSVGMCFPESCSTWDAMQLGQILSNLIPLNITKKDRPPSMTCQDKMELSNNAIIVIVVCSVFLFIVLVATAYDIFILLFLSTQPEGYKILPETQSDTMESTKFTNGHVANGNGPNAAATDETTALLNTSYKHGIISHHGNDMQKIKQQSNTVEYKPGTLGQMLLAFSVYTNTKKILNTKQPAGTLTSVNGIRFISMTWVILGHTYAFGLNLAENEFQFYFDVGRRWSFQVILNATVAVDTFFVLSGLLVSYLSLKEMKKRDGARKFNWFMFYFHRFWRLTPPYMLFLMFYVTLMKYWGDGPIWPQHGTDMNGCKDTWWTNLLYINNVVKSKEMCMGWSWYLANDMQFYVISPFMLIPLYYSKLWGSVCCFALVLTNLIAAGIISKENHLAANLVLGNAGEGDSFDLIYIKPWCRVGPYAVGFFTGYLLYMTNCKVRLSKIVNLICWCVAAAVALMVLYGLYTDDMSQKLGEDMSALYNATSRTAWGMCIAWVIFACATGNGGPINTLLSWPAIIPLSRLTYCAYLVHPVILYTYYYSRRTLMYWYDLEVIYMFLGNLCLSYAVAFVVSLVFESPMMGLEKALLGRSKNS